MLGKRSLVAFAFAILMTPALLGQTATAPIPSQLVTAQTAFLSNHGGLDNYGNQTAYRYFYQAMTSWKRFQLETKPSDAELSFEISITPYAASAFTPGFVHLDIRDIKTQILLWSFQEVVNGNANDKDFAAAVTALVGDFNSLVTGIPAKPLTKTRFSEAK